MPGRARHDGVDALGDGGSHTGPDPASPGGELDFLQEFGTDVAGGDCRVAVDGDYQSAVSLDAPDYALGALEQSSGDTNPVTLQEIFGDRNQHNKVV